MSPEAVQRISLRWLPEPAYEDTDTIALNVGGYFIDLRVTEADSTIQWSRAGERITLRSEPRKSYLLFFKHRYTQLIPHQPPSDGRTSSTLST